MYQCAFVHRQLLTVCITQLAGLFCLFIEIIIADQYAFFGLVIIGWIKYLCYLVVGMRDAAIDRDADDEGVDDGDGG